MEKIFSLSINKIRNRLPAIKSNSTQLNKLLSAMWLRWSVSNLSCLIWKISNLSLFTSLSLNLSGLITSIPNSHGKLLKSISLNNFKAILFKSKSMEQKSIVIKWTFMGKFSESKMEMISSKWSYKMGMLNFLKMRTNTFLRKWSKSSLSWLSMLKNHTKASGHSKITSK